MSAVICQIPEERLLFADGLVDVVQSRIGPQLRGIPIFGCFRVVKPYCLVVLDEHKTAWILLVHLVLFVVHYVREVVAAGGRDKGTVKPTLVGQHSLEGTDVPLTGHHIEIANTLQNLR